MNFKMLKAIIINILAIFFIIGCGKPSPKQIKKVLMDFGAPKM